MLSRLLNPEARLLFACLKPNEAELRSALSASIEWRALCEMLDREGAAIHLWRAIEPYASDIPDAYALRLRGLARVTHFRMLHLEQRTRDAVGTLHDAGVDCVLLKGAALAISVYRSFVERPMRDVDILVRPDVVEVAKRLLLRSGWVAPMQGSAAGSDEKSHHIPPLVDSRSLGLVLELHRALLTEGHPFGLSTDLLFENSQPLGDRLLGARVFTPTFLLIHACIHFAYIHMFRQGAWRTFRDLARIVSLEGFSWPTFVECAIRIRAASCAYWVLRLASELTDVAVPRDVLSELAPPLSEQVRLMLARHFVLILSPGAQDCPSIGLRRLLWSSAIRPSWSGHGAARPWTLFTGPIGAAATDARQDEIAANARRSARAWSRYVARILVGS